MVAQVGAAARAYGALTMASLRSSVQRPATLVVRGIGSALVALCEAVGVVLLVDRFGSIAGWRTPEIIVLAGLVFTGQGLAQAVGNRLRPDDVSLMIRRGTFDQVLMKPVGGYLSRRTFHPGSWWQVRRERYPPTGFISTWSKVPLRIISDTSSGRSRLPTACARPCPVKTSPASTMISGVRQPAMEPKRSTSSTTPTASHSATIARRPPAQPPWTTSRRLASASSARLPAPSTASQMTWPASAAATDWPTATRTGAIINANRGLASTTARSAVGK